MRQRINYKMQTPSQRRKSNHLAKLRMQKYRAKMKDEENAKKSLRSDALQLKEKKAAQQEYWREKQKLCCARTRW